MRPKNIKRLLRALSREGLDVTYHDHIYTVRLSDSPEDIAAQVLLPEDFPVEAKALKQLADLANVHHPAGGKVNKCCATPDFHPGEGGIAIGSVVETTDLVMPAAVGSDINCGMRLHVADLSLDRFMAKRNQFVELMKGKYFFGTRDVTMNLKSAQALFEYGIPGWLDAMQHKPLGDLIDSDLNQLFSEIERVYLSGSLQGAMQWVPEKWGTKTGLIRDSGLATIGGGNHFVEVQVVEKIVDRAMAYAWGIKVGQLAFMIHSGSRLVGKHIGTLWRKRAESLWPQTYPYPKSRLFPLSDPDSITAYLQAEATAANYGFVNRLWLAELLRLRLRALYGDIEAPLIYDLPHNLTLSEGVGWIARKGACPAHTGQPVIIPGSMGAPSYLLMGKGNADFLCSASHGAGRLHSRFELNQKGDNEAALGLTGVDCITLRSERRIEEAPAAYKPIQPIIDIQVAAKMISVVAHLRPVLTFKA
jgi:tRNA-splicing ligase RtcB (3'-phosphate/5'-hydroxy nucleic acid ligase)